MPPTNAKIFSENNPNLRVDFNDVKLISKIEEKGLNVRWEKMCVCPCRKDISSQAVVDCINCDGTGWYFFGSQNIKALVSGAQFSRNFLMWTENLSGSVIITVDPIYKVGWNDKLVILDAETVFSEVKQVKILNEDDGIKTIKLRYPANTIVSAFSYLNSDENLRALDLNNLTINGHYLTINDNVIEEGENISLVYYYNPSYLVVDNLNDYRNTYVKNKLPEEQLRKLPIKVLAKKLHLVWV